MNQVMREDIEQQLAGFQAEYATGRQRLAEIQEAVDALGNEAGTISHHLTRVEGAMHALHVVLQGFEPQDQQPVNLNDFRP